MKAKLKSIQPKQYSNPEVRKEMYDCIDAAMQSKSPIIGYAFVSFHEDGSFHPYYRAPKGVSGVDVPDMVRSRLQMGVIKGTING